MKNIVTDRKKRISRLPIELLLSALIVGFAAVGQAEDIPQMVITAERPTVCETSVDLRDQMRTTANSAVWKTQIRVGVDLSMKLKRDNGWIQLAATPDRKRG
jgi:hypothetical protein